jgi:hypothetical protein
MKHRIEVAQTLTYVADIEAETLAEAEAKLAEMIEDGDDNELSEHDSTAYEIVRENQPNWEGFAREVMTMWPDGDLDGGDLQELAVVYKMILPVPGGYDPKVHAADDEYGTEPGDDWFVRNY